MKDLSVVILYLFCLIRVYNANDLFSLYMLGVLSVFFFISYSSTRRKCIECDNYCKNIIHRQKSYFVDILNHDIKVPILAQLRALGILKNGIMGGVNIEQKELIEQIEASCKCALDMISMINNAHEIDNKTEKLNYEKFNMTDLLFSCFNELSCNAKEKKLTFSYSSKTEKNYVEADLYGIKKVITSLLLNAINYSKYGDEISVNINSSRNRLTFSVSGMGLLESTAEDKNQYTTIGHNIGMYLCKKIIEFHKGKFYSHNCTKNTLSFVIPTKINSFCLS